MSIAKSQSGVVAQDEFADTEKIVADRDDITVTEGNGPIGCVKPTSAAQNDRKTLFYGVFEVLYGR